MSREFASSFLAVAGRVKFPRAFPAAEARNQFLACLRRFAPLAEAQDIVLVLECLNRKECNFVNSLAEGAALVRRLIILTCACWPIFITWPWRAKQPTKSSSMAVGCSTSMWRRRKVGRHPAPTVRISAPFCARCRRSIIAAQSVSSVRWQDLPEQASGSVKSFREQLRQAYLI